VLQNRTSGRRGPLLPCILIQTPPGLLNLHYIVKGISDSQLWIPMVSLLLAVLLTLLEPLMTFPKRQLLHFHIEIPGILKFSFQVFKHFSFCRFHTLHVSQKIHRQAEWRNLVSDKETKTKPTAVSVYCALSQIVQTEIGIWKNTVQGLWKSQLPFPGQGVMTLRDEVEGLLIQNFAYLEM